MKKSVIVLAAAVLAMTPACTRVEVNETAPDRKITFQTANYVPQTKAEVSFLGEFDDPADARFYCMAYMKGNGADGLQPFFGENGETVKWKAGTKEWSPDRIYYWPKSEGSYINFFSWYDTKAITDADAKLAVGNGTMTWTDRVIDPADNIMYADPAWHFRQNTSPATYGKDEVSEGIPTLFHHALAQVEVRAYAEKLSVAGLCTWTIRLSDITLGGIYNQGTLSLTATGDNAEPENAYNVKGVWDAASWSPSGEAQTYSQDPVDITKEKVTSGEQTYDSVFANRNVLPQDLEGVLLRFKLYIKTTYTTSGESNEESISFEIPLAAATDATPAGFGTAEWKMNTKYIYTLKIVPGENKILFDPAVENAWETSSSEVQVPDGTENPDDPDDGPDTGGLEDYNTQTSVNW